MWYLVQRQLTSQPLALNFAELTNAADVGMRKFHMGTDENGVQVTETAPCLRVQSGPSEQETWYIKMTMTEFLSLTKPEVI